MNVHDELQSLLARWRAPTGDTVLLLADQGGLGGHPAFEALCKQRAATNLLSPGATVLDTASPIGIDVSGLLEPVPQAGAAIRLKELLIASRWASALSVLVSPLPYEELCRRLHRRCDVRLPDDCDYVLRYFDPRILPVLLGALEPHQYSAFVGMCRHWAYLDREGRWIEVEGAHVLEHDPACLMPLQLDERQQGILIDANTADAVLALLREQEQPALQALNPAQQHARVSEGVARASELGIVAPLDQAAFCSLALTYGPEFHLQEPWATHLRAVRLGQAKFGQMETQR